MVVVDRIERRLAALLNWPIENGEGLQVLRYRPGAEYKAHHDYFDPAAPGTPTILQRGGQRVASIVMYLNTPQRGGGTAFPDVGVEVGPMRGNAVFFSYDRPHVVTRTLHAGSAGARRRKVGRHQVAARTRIPLIWAHSEVAAARAPRRARAVEALGCAGTHGLARLKGAASGLAARSTASLDRIAALRRRVGTLTACCWG